MVPWGLGTRERVRGTLSWRGWTWEALRPTTYVESAPRNHILFIGAFLEGTQMERSLSREIGNKRLVWSLAQVAGPPPPVPNEARVAQGSLAGGALCAGVASVHPIQVLLASALKLDNLDGEVT